MALIKKKTINIWEYLNLLEFDIMEVTLFQKMPSNSWLKSMSDLHETIA